MQKGAVPHKYYLINFKLPPNSATNQNLRIGRIEHMNMPGLPSMLLKNIDLKFLVIFQPARFTKVWLALQTLIFILQWISVGWYSQRLFDLNRPKTLIEKSILTIACGIQFANFPLQWIALRE